MTSPIQLLLIFGTFAGLWIYFSFFKTVTRSRFALMGMGLLAAYFILHPEALSRVARHIGVGRGTDLLFYLSLLAGSFVVLNLTGKVAVLERERTVLARELALLRTELEHSKFEAPDRA
jgi:small membrane protein